MLVILTQPSPYPHQSQAAQDPLLLVSLGEMPFWLTRNAVSRRAKWHFSVYCVVLIAKYDVYDAKVWHLQVLSDILMDSGQ
jgi:hypothetical protein